jgi:hypothetical protein
VGFEFNTMVCPTSRTGEAGVIAPAVTARKLWIGARPAALEAAGAIAERRGEREGLAPVEEEAKEGAEPTTTLEPEIEIVDVWVAVAAGEAVTAGAAEEALAPPDDAAGATTAPMGPSAAAPSMMIDTAMASHTALLRGVIGQGIVTSP